MQPRNGFVFDPAPRLAFRRKCISDLFRLAAGHRYSHVIAVADPPRLNIENHFRFALSLCFNKTAFAPQRYSGRVLALFFRRKGPVLDLPRGAISTTIFAAWEKSLGRLGGFANVMAAHPPALNWLRSNPQPRFW